MIEKIHTPLGVLSRVGDFNIDLQLKGKHIESLSNASSANNDSVNDRAVLEVIKDLTDNAIDPFKLSRSEMFYVFLLIKSTSVSPKIKFKTKCPHMVKTALGTFADCGYVNEVEYNFSDSDVIRVPGNYKVPTIKFPDSDKTYKILPLSMELEFTLLEYFIEHGYDINELKKKNCSYGPLYAFHRYLLSLVEENNSEPFKDHAIRESFVEKLRECPYSILQNLAKAIQEEEAFGVRQKVINVTCKGCGATFRTVSALMSGLYL